MSAIRPTADGVAFNVKAVPRASRTELAGWMGDALRVRLRAPPVEGKANRALVEFLAEVLGVAARRVAIAAGDLSRHKRVAVAGLTPAEAEARLAAAATPAPPPPPARRP